jgi:hypothetical protein
VKQCQTVTRHESPNRQQNTKRAPTSDPHPARPDTAGRGRARADSISEASERRAPGRGHGSCGPCCCLTVRVAVVGLGENFESRATRLPAESALTAAFPCLRLRRRILRRGVPDTKPPPAGAIVGLKHLQRLNCMLLVPRYCSTVLCSCSSGNAALELKSPHWDIIRKINRDGAFEKRAAPASDHEHAASNVH